jgi:hypothetical protein
MAQSSLAIAEGPDASIGGLGIVEGPEGHDAPAPPSLRAKSLQHRRAVEARRQAGQEPVLEALEGVGRGAISTVQGLAKPIRKAFGMPPATPPEAETTTAGKVGRAAEQVGEFFAPDTIGGKVAKAVKGGRLVRAGIHAGISAAGNYAVASAQGDTRPSAAAALGAAGPAAELTVPAVYKLLRSGAKAGLAKVLGASSLAPDAINAAVQEVVPVALADGLKPTWGAWLKQRSLAKGKAGASLEKALEGPLGSSLVPTKPVIDALDELANKAAQHVMNAEETLAGATAGKPVAGDVVSGKVVYNKRLMKNINDLKSVLKNHGDVVQARQLVDLKRSWDDFVYKANEFPNKKKILLGLEARAKNAAANAVRGVLDSDVPKIADLDKAYSLSVRLYDLVRKAATGEEVGAAVGSAAKKASTAMGRRAAIAGGGAVVGAGAGYERTHSIRGAVVGGLIGGVATRMLETALASPAWRLLPAATKTSIADAIANEKADLVRRLLTPVIAKTVAGSPDKATP